jgi:2-polyprenyl-6-methoxyphenol hydroxylase-like FAD-dependent oxidoreductase
MTTAGKRILDLPPAQPDSRFFTMAASRGSLRNSLLQELKPETVKWNSRCAGYAVENGRPVVLLEDKTTYHADVVIACDGVNSVIRRQMLGDAPRFLGLVTLRGVIRQDISQQVAKCGSFMTLGRGMSFIFSRFPESVWCWAFTMQAREKQFAHMSPTEWKAVFCARWKSGTSRLPS